MYLYQLSVFYVFNVRVFGCPELFYFHADMQVHCVSCLPIDMLHVPEALYGYTWVWLYWTDALLLFTGTSASSYASAQMVSEETVSKFKEYETKTPGLSYGMVQSAATSSEFVSRCVVKQKKKSLLQ